VRLESLFYGGFVPGVILVEAAALTVVYSPLIECFIHRELSIRHDLPSVAIESTKLVGGFMIIIGVALAFTNYLVIAQVPMHVLSWVREYIESPLTGLLALNVLLIIVGALMEIYSAIIVIVPLIVPIAAAYGINPVHLGIIFMANMQLGYLMPPMGENLFLSAYRFNKDLPEIYVSTVAVHRHPVRHRAPHHLCPLAHARAAGMVRTLNRPRRGRRFLPFSGHLGEHAGSGLARHGRDRGRVSTARIE